MSGAISDLKRAIKLLEGEFAHEADADLSLHAAHGCSEVLPSMLNVRAAADSLEALVADDLWPLPTSEEMLFIL